MQLTKKDITEVMQKIEKIFESTQDKIKICLLIEESLLRCQEKFGENKNFEFVTKKWFGTPKILIKIKGAPYNPIEDNDEQIFSEQVIKNLLNYEQAGLIYRYENGCNEITVVANKEIKNLKIPGGNVTVAIILAIIFGLIMQNFPEPTQKFIAESLISPILHKLFGVIVAVNIPLIFISIIASICSIDNVSMLYDLSIKIFKRFLGILFFVSITAVFINEIIFSVIKFNFGGQISSNNYDEMQKIFSLILNILPQNIVEPFFEENVLQIVVLALIIGICITILGNRVQDIKKLILDLQQIINKMVSIVFKIIPAIIFLCVLKIILLNSTSEIFSGWKIIAAQYSIYIFLSLTMLSKNYFLYKINILDFLKTIYPACLITFTTSSGSAAMPKNIKICKEKLKISKTLCDFYIPLSHPMCPTMKTVAFITWSFFAAQFSCEQITLAQLFIIIFFSIQFAISSSNSGSGGMMAMATLLLTQINFSVDAIGVIMVLDIFASQISGVIELIIRDCNLVDFSRKIDFK